MARRNSKKWRSLDGILLLDKPLGVSSNKALQNTRFLYQAAKAGHTGSLDPLASGMLPVCFGEATKVSAYLLDADKRYLTTATLGAVSSTGDAEGELDFRGAVPEFSDAELEAVLTEFRGEIHQIPPMYSALKQQGQPLYKLARQGVSVEREARTVFIHELTLQQRTPLTLDLDVRCSKGTYIRSLVEDIGEALGCGAYVSALRRTEVSPFQCLPVYTPRFLQQTSEQGGLAALDELLLPMDKALPHLPALVLDTSSILRLQQGQKLSLNQFSEQPPCGLVRTYTESSVFAGLAEVTPQMVKAKRMLSGLSLN
ncbi:MAG: tRNA pseudouridine(55) synthase TruB [Thiolinea sp.]